MPRGFSKMSWGLRALQNYHAIRTFKAGELNGLKARHPFVERDSLLILARHVTLEAGTGAVHTAPGHGREDYEAALEYGLDIYSPVDDDGRFTKDVEFFAGQFVFDANKAVIAKLEENESCCKRAKSSTAILTAGAAKTRSFSAPRPSGSFRWRRPACAARRSSG